MHGHPRQGVYLHVRFSWSALVCSVAVDPALQSVRSPVGWTPCTFTAESWQLHCYAITEGLTPTNSIRGVGTPCSRAVARSLPAVGKTAGLLLADT